MSSEMDSKKATAILGVPGRLLALQEGSGRKSKADFLRAVKIQKGQWARYLKGEMPGPAVRQRIANATGVSPEWIVTGKDQPQTLHPKAPARAVQDTLHPASILESLGAFGMDHNEHLLFMPLIRALIQTYRKDERTFAHLLEQARWAVERAGIDEKDLLLAIATFERLKGYSVVPGKTATHKVRRRS